MIKRTLAMGLLALAMSIDAHAAQGADLASPGNPPAGATDRAAVEGSSSPRAPFVEAADKATDPAGGRVAPPSMPVTRLPENLAYALIGLGLLIGMLARRRR